MLTNAPSPLLEIRRKWGEITLRFPDCIQLDESLAETLRAELFAAARDAGGHHLVLDLAPIEFLTSSILGALLSFHRAVAVAGGRLTVANARPELREVFAVTCLDRILNLGPA